MAFLEEKNGDFYLKGGDREELYILAGQSIGLTIFKNGVWEFDNDTARIYMDRLKNEPGIDRHQGGVTADMQVKLDNTSTSRILTLG